MPTYNFKCSSCGEEFEKVCRISDMKLQTCTHCGSKEYETVIGASKFADPVRIGVRTIDNGFREVLSKIKEKNYKSNLGNKLSR